MIIKVPVKRFWVLVALLGSLAGCGESAADRDFLFPVSVEDGDAVFTGSACDIDFAVSNLSNRFEYTLVWMQVTVFGDDGTVTSEIYDTGEQQLLIGSQLPPGRSSFGEQSIDISQATLGDPPYDGSVQFIGIGVGETTHFFGGFVCE